MKKTLVVFLVLLGVIPDRTFSQGKYNNRIQLTAGNFVVPGHRYEKLFQPFLRNVGISIKRDISNHISVSAAYNRWYNWNMLYGVYSPEINGYGENTSMATWKAEDVRSRYDYRMVDAIGNYSVWHKKHELYAGVGVSIATGKNVVIVDVYQHPGYPDILVKSKTERAIYAGGLLQGGYNYLLLKNRINAGVSGAVRCYPSLPFQYYININLGYNFNL